MDFDFALILVVLTFIAALGWFYDRLALAGARKERIAAATKQTGGTLPESALEQLNKENGLIDLCRSLFPVLFVVLILRSFVVEPFQIPSGSMKPTLKIGDFILVNKWHYGFRLPVIGTNVLPMNKPQRGDVAVFKYPQEPSVNYIKRVVGLPGDRIRYQNKTLFVNGEAQAQTLLAQLPPKRPRVLLVEEQLGEVSHQIYRDVGQARIAAEWVVPEGHYFMVGDNRDNSNDSRFWGFVPDELLVGKAFAVWMHWQDFFTLPEFGDVRAIH
ncbi:signal peptidase I [Amphritea balenae]|uniref:Signal peptidase I n=1 Tax=Amphritea balenae TaxID=452629 RepID=A0A3P1SMP0_9GAMM|nr:signal peptidase I [Amphritea balenae]RRC98387.1 signal peptidase I [Amphritea balenae]GGK81484.1 signal peptidase I [Amphritea balenae]